MGIGTCGGNIYSNAAVISVSPTITTLSQVVLASNPARVGMVIYNNSANTVYLSFADTANSGTKCGYALPSFTQLAFLQGLIYTGTISGIRNAGTGTCVVTEFS